MDRKDLLIHGEAVPPLSTEYFKCINPATGLTIAEVAQAGESDVDAAVASARRASAEWALTESSDRGACVGRVANALEAAREEVAMIDSLDAGKPYLDCLEDVTAAVKVLRFFAGLADKVHGHTLPVQAGYIAMTLREPYGVIAAIVPWNYPIYNACIKVGAIIAMGNCCVLKPAEQAPLSALRLGELALEAGLPRGVLNVVTGDGRTGALLAGHMDVDKISFTGSTDTGRAVLTAAAQSNLKPCCLELGGKSPCVVFADANLAAAAEALAFSVFFNQGQTCTAATRLIVESSVAAEFVERLRTKALAIKVGDPLEEDTQLGPLVSSDQYARVMSYLTNAKDSGAEVVCGEGADGSVALGGLYVRPTILRGLDPSAEASREEIFGPVLSVFEFSGEDEAISLANAVSYGLAASVWTQDVGRMNRMVAAVQSGVVWGNCVFVEHPSVPVGGYKQSGFGKEYGLEAGSEYTRTKSVWLNSTDDVLQWTGA